MSAVRPWPDGSNFTRQLLTGPQPAQNRQLLFRAAAAAMKVEPGSKIIVFAHADADAESETAAGKEINGGRLAGKQRGLARRSDHYTSHQPDALSRSRCHRQDRKRFERLGNDPIGDDDTRKWSMLGTGDPFEHQCAGSRRYPT